METRTEGVAQTGQRQLVLFHLAGEIYAVDIHQVREIIRLPQITRVPRTPDFVEGVINLRGNVIPVLDLRKRFGLGEGEESADRRIIVVEMGERTIGMIVDAVSEVLRIDETLIDPPSPYIVSVNTLYIEGIARLEPDLVILLNLEKVLTEDEKERLESMDFEEEGEGHVGV